MYDFYEKIRALLKPIAVSIRETPAPQQRSVQHKAKPAVPGLPLKSRRSLYKSDEGNDGNLRVPEELYPNRMFPVESSQ
jgi:hypothetical protein